MKKRAGVLFPLSSLPSRYGVGDFGEEAYQWIDMMVENHIQIWQILPLNPLGYGNSPYQPLSSHAGDELYISLDLLCKEGLIPKRMLEVFHDESSRVDYEAIREIKNKLFRHAFMHFEETEDYLKFIQREKWVKDYAIFKVFKLVNHNLPWIEWDEDFKNCKQDYIEKYDEDIRFQMFLQYCFYKQWNALKDYAHRHHMTIIGDMPIYVGLDSVDVWKNQDCFLLDEIGHPTFVAGVPPDYFSKFGQRWGNPLYDWDYLSKHHFDFWVERMKAAVSLYDVVRIDHFRAFDTFWKIPEIEPTAIHGEWIEAPGYDLFDTLYARIPHLSLLAEDLGDLRQEVYDLRDHYHLMGMYIFQFHHSQDMDLSHVVVYTGTHDNDTLKGWLEDIPKKEHKELITLLKEYKEKEIYQKIIHYCLDTDAKDVIVPIWDVLGCEHEARFNVPGKIGSPNWEYRLPSFEGVDDDFKLYKNMIDESGRKEE